MTIPTKVEINCETGAISEVPLSDDELAQLKIDQNTAEADRVKRENDAKTLNDLKASAKAKLIAGKALTAEEAAVLVI
jgi:hypothetical protein